MSGLTSRFPPQAPIHCLSWRWWQHLYPWCWHLPPSLDHCSHGWRHICKMMATSWESFSGVCPESFICRSRLENSWMITWAGMVTWHMYVRNVLIHCGDFAYSFFNSFPPGQNGLSLADDNFKCIFVNENDTQMIEFKFKFHRNLFPGAIDNNPALAPIMAWPRTDDKPLLEPMLTQFTNAYMRH